LFNHRAAHAINWQAQSRALAIERGIDNVGPLSPLVLDFDLQLLSCGLDLSPLGMSLWIVHIVHHPIHVAPGTTSRASSSCFAGRPFT
jgi:hypothetical protein